MTNKELFRLYARSAGYPYSYQILSNSEDGDAIYTKRKGKLVPYMCVVSYRKYKMIVFESYIGRYSVNYTELEQKIAVSSGKT